jgi:uridine phosphorylase
VTKKGPKPSKTEAKRQQDQTQTKPKEKIQGSEVVKTASGRQYHIGVAPEEVAPYILLCGDPARAEKVSALFDKVEFRLANREFLTFTGRYQGMPISIMGTGIGPDNTEIAVIELLQCSPQATLLRIGSCGGLQPQISLGDLVVSTGAVRLENTSTYFVPEGYPAVAHYEVVMALVEACKSLKFPFHVGITATAPGFYGAQGRKVPGFPPRYPHMVEDLVQLGVLNFEMETSALLTLASLGKVRAGAVCAIYADRSQNAFVSPQDKDEAEQRCIHAGLAAMKFLYRLDLLRKTKKDSQWLPLESLAEAGD